MRVALLTLAIVMGLEGDLQALLWLVALLPAVAAAVVVTLLLGYQPRPLPALPSWAPSGQHATDARPDGWRPAHVAPSYVARHGPGGKPVSLLIEHTVEISKDALLPPW